jgi:uroporphyrinogen-III synthase
MRIILTRPLEDAAPLADKLRKLGHVPIVTPLLKIEARQNISVPCKQYQAICLTSANAIRVMGSIDAIENIPVFAVGQQSEKMANDKGFVQVSAHGGDVIGLHRFLIGHLKPEDGPLLYLSGSETSGDMQGRLQDSGFDVDRIITYDAVKSSLSEFKTEIESAEAVLLYSPRTAKLWATEIETLKLTHVACRIKHICLSANVAANLPQSWPRAIAAAPTESALLALLD